MSIYESRHKDKKNIFFSITLIQTVESIRFSPMVLPVCITPDRAGPNVTAILAGFGQTRTEPRLDTKQFLVSATISNADCRRAYRFMPFNAVRIFDSSMCVANPAGKGACGGDSGGSIVVDNVSIGVISWVGVDCALGNPDVYVRTAPYYDWIRNVTEIERSEE
jgi:hypothetical protein